MEEKQKIQRQLQQLRQECIKEYLEPKLSAIASKEVIYDILKGFLEAHNHQFLQNIAENIFEVKQYNRGLKESMETLKISHQQELIVLRHTILQQEQSRQKSELERLTKQFQFLISKMEAQNKRNIEKMKDLEQQKRLVYEKIKSLQSQYLKIQQQLDESNRKQQLTIIQKEKLYIEVIKNKQTFIKFKQSCQKIINDSNKEKQIEKKKLIEEIEMEKMQFEKKERQYKFIAEERQTHQKDLFLKQISRKEDQIAYYVDSFQKIKEQNCIFESKLQDERLQLEQQRLSNKQITQNIKILTDKLQNLIKQLQSNDITIKYLQEENNYLREEIISFRTRYDALEQQKIKITQQFEQFTARTEKDRQIIQKEYLREVENIKNDMNLIRDEEQNKLQDMIAQLEKLRGELQVYQNQISEKKEKIQILASANSILQHQNEDLSQEIKRYINSNQVHENQINCYQKQLNKVRQQCKEEIDRHKTTFELNWNTANQELLEEKFKQTELRETIEHLKQQLSLQKEKEKYYSLYVQEIQQLKKQLKLCNPMSKNINQSKHYLPSNKVQKIYYFISKVNEELKLLKTESNKFAQLILHSIADYNCYYQQTVQYLLLKSRQEYYQCSYCQQQSKLKNSLKMEFSEAKLQKTMQRGYKQSSSFGTIKKTLKNIQLKYEVVNQSNTFYRNHIDSLIRKQ